MGPLNIIINAKMGKEKAFILFFLVKLRFLAQDKVIVLKSEPKVEVRLLKVVLF